MKEQSSRLLQVHRDDASPVDAAFRTEWRDSVLCILWESRGGTRGSSQARNTQYSEGLVILLKRLAQLQARVVDIQVDSSRTARLAADARRVELPGRAYPVSIDDPESLAKSIGAAQAQVARAPNALGSGNSTRRLCIEVEGEQLSAVGDLSGFLEFGHAN